MIKTPDNVAFANFKKVLKIKSLFESRCNNDEHESITT